ncbi:MAG: tRNA (adenosine(37)-N6)-threonylcarbamoyltransferase complex dimerization subunit type 1 TsaB, partial [Bacillota bacterium]|nr:tRNA (adenosine(37)-N6)-threonylcarbamoyltransferase complex dimerization subunit type 1 TsaB [Bacillota bacterium]
MKILAFDCSSKTMAAAVADGHKVLAKAYSRENRNHAPYLLPMINQVVEDSGLTFKDLELIGVTAGPGSFTGLRIGIATAKGFSDTLNIPMVAIDSLDALVQGFSEYRNVIAAMLDARKNQVYAAVYDNRDGRMLKIMEDTPLSPTEDLASFLGEYREILFVGDGVPGWRQALEDTYGERCVFPLDAPLGIVGESLVSMTSAAKSWELVRDISPHYIRGVDAKAKFLRCDFQRLKPGDVDELLLLEQAAFSTPWTRQMFL